MTTHQMTSDDGERWTCPICGRVVIVNPAAAKVFDVLIEGDPLAVHQGGAVVISSVDAYEATLEPFAEWAEANL